MTQYRPEIDGLRAIAVGAVILFHAGFAVFSGGYVGVDVFFVISGYLITGILMKDLAEDRFSILKFYERRARRILPALVFVLIATVPFAWLWMYPSQLLDFGKAVLAVVVFASNILFWREVDYFAPDVENNPLLHTWSLAVEEQFYIFFPLLLLLIWRYARRGLLPIFIVLLLLSLGAAELGWRFAPGANFYLLPTRAWELLAGSICAVLANRQAIRPNGALALAGLAMILAAIFVFDDNTPFPSLYAILPVLGSALIILTAGQATLVGRFLSLRAMTGIGLISYSAYLWHQPLFAFARLRSAAALSLPLALALIALTLCLAVFSWWFVERPFRAGPRTIIRTQRGVFATSGLALMLLVELGMGLVLGKGLPGRLAPSGQSFATLDIDTRLSGNNGLGPQCAKGFNRPDSCRTSGPDQVLLWGDSYAMHLAKILIGSPNASGIVQYTMPACAPIMGISRVNSKYPLSWAKGCVAFNNEVLSWLRATPAIRYVVMSSPMAILREGVYLPGSGVVTTGVEALVLKQMRETARAIRAAGAIPVFVSPPPRTGEDLASCGVAALIFGRGGHEDCDFAETAIWQESHDIDAALAQLEPDMRIFPLKDMICANGRCPTVLDGTLLFRDKGHLSNEGAVLLGKRFDLLGRIRALEPVTP